MMTFYRDGTGQQIAEIFNYSLILTLIILLQLITRQ